MAQKEVVKEKSKVSLIYYIILYYIILYYIDFCRKEEKMERELKYIYHNFQTAIHARKDGVKVKFISNF